MWLINRKKGKRTEIPDFKLIPPAPPPPEKKDDLSAILASCKLLCSSEMVQRHYKGTADLIIERINKFRRN